MNKKQLAVILSVLGRFSQPKVELEQYATDGEIAATVLWHAYMQGHIKDKIVADFGCGTGILGIGCLLLGAKKVIFVDCDEVAIAVLKKNLSMINETYEFPGTYDVLYRDIDSIFTPVDTVIQNPPFGTKDKHADKVFLEKACSLAKMVYSFHKTNTAAFVQALARDYHFVVKEQFDFSFPLKKTMPQHIKTVEKIEVSCFYLVKK